MSGEKKTEEQGFSFYGVVSKGLSVAHKGLGDRPHKKVGTAIITGSALYGYFVDPVGGIIGAIAGLGVRYPEQTLAAAQYADSVVDALLGRKPEAQFPSLKPVAAVADEAKMGKFASLVNDARERKASGKMKGGDEDIIEAGIELGV